MKRAIFMLAVVGMLLGIAAPAFSQFGCNIYISDSMFQGRLLDGPFCNMSACQRAKDQFADYYGYNRCPSTASTSTISGVALSDGNPVREVIVAKWISRRAITWPCRQKIVLPSVVSGGGKVPAIANSQSHTEWLAGSLCSLAEGGPETRKGGYDSTIVGCDGSVLAK